MAAKKIGVSLVLQGEKEYRNALKSISTEQSRLRSEMKLAESQDKGRLNSLDALQKKYKLLSDQLAQVEKKEQTHAAAVRFQQEQQEKAAQSIEKYKQQLGSAQRSLEDMQRSGAYTNKELEAQQKVINAIQADLTKAENKYETAGRKVKEYGTRQNEAKVETAELKEAVAETGRYLKEAEHSFTGAAVSIDKYGNETGKASEATLRMTEMIKANIGSEAIIAAAKKLVGAIKEISSAAIEVGSQFEASMSQVAATMAISQSSAEYEKLSSAAKQMGATTMYSASQAAEALNYLALAGYDANKAVATLPKVLDLAAAGGLDLAYASDLVTDSMAALGMETSELDSYVDQMARTSQKSNTNIAQLGEATLVAAGAVSTANMDIIDMNTALGILANNGIKGAEGGTHLRNAILSLAAPTDKAAKALKDLGVETTTSSGDLRNLNDIMIDLNAALDGMGSAEKASYIKKIFNKTDISAVNALLKGSGDEYRNLRKEIENASGAAGQMADTLNDNLKGKVTILKSALEALGIAAYETFDDELKAGVESATDAVGRMQHAIEHGDLGVSLERMAQALGRLVERAVDFGTVAMPPVINVLSFLLDNAGLLVGSIGAAVAAWNAYKLTVMATAVQQGALNAVMAANPIGMVLTAVAGLSAAVVGLGLAFSDTTGWMSETAQASHDLAEEARQLNEAYADEASQRANSRADREAQVQDAKALADELKDLQKSTKLSADEQLRQAEIVTQLNSLVPDLNLVIDEQTGKLTENSKAALDNVEAMMKLAMVEAAQEDLKRIGEEQYETKKKLREIDAQLIEQEEKAGQAAQARAAAYEDLGNTESSAAQERWELKKVAEAEAEALEELRGQQEELLRTEEALDAEFADTVTYIDENNAALASLAGATQEAAQGVEEGAQIISDAFANLSEEEQQLVLDTAQTFSEFDGIFGELVTKSEVSLSQMAENLEKNASAFAEHAKNIKTATDDIRYGTDENYTAFVDNLISRGTEGVAALAEFANGAEEEQQRVLDAFSGFTEAQGDLELSFYGEWLTKEEENAVKLQTLLATTNEELVHLSTDPQDIIKQATGEYWGEMTEMYQKGPQDLAQGISDNVGALETAGTSMGEGTVKGAMTAMGIYREGGQSAVLYGLGQSADESMAQGITDNQGLIQDAMQKAVDSSVDNINFNKLTTRINQKLGEAMQ